jgi:hypothetical protein
MTKKVASVVVSVVVPLVGLLASVGPAAETVQNAFGFLWPTGVVGILSVLCLGESWLLWRLRQPPAEEATNDESSDGTTEQRETAYEAVLSASEQYLNAHRGMPDYSDPQEVDVFELEEAGHVVDAANQRFVAARQLIEQHGSGPVLDATLRLEDAVNARELDRAAEIRRKDLVPAIRADRKLVKISPAEKQADQELTSAIDNLLDELATIHSRLTKAIDKSHYDYNFLLPSAAYVKHREAIGLRSREAREVLSEVYIQADALNHQLPGGTSDGIDLRYIRDPDAHRLREIVSRAQAALRQLRP